jgi:hypothetical protein
MVSLCVNSMTHPVRGHHRSVAGEMWQIVLRALLVPERRNLIPDLLRLVKAP